jgi:pimeloyl-ACP methyl ester carboxylesterase
LKVLYPFDNLSFESSGGSMNYVDVGEGAPVVMIHGNPTWSFFYRDLILELQDDFRCLALDNLGCGHSDKPQDGDYTLSGHIDRACEWLNDLNLESFHLVVHDWGGAIGMGVADKLRDRVKGITILNTAAFAFPSISWRIAICRIPFIGALLVRGANGFVLGATKMTTVNPLSDAAKEGFCYPYQNWHDRIAIHKFVRDIPMSSHHPSWKTLKSVEASLEQWKQVPVQIIWGMHDWCFNPEILQRWEEILPQATVHRMDDAGHYLLEDSGEEIFPLIKSFAADLGN